MLLTLSYFWYFFKWLKKNVKNTSYRFVLEPAISDDGAYHSWELLTKDIIAPAQNNTSAPTFSFSTLTERDKTCTIYPANQNCFPSLIFPGR